MGVIIPEYVSDSTGAVVSNVYVSLLNDAFPTSQNIGNYRRWRSTTTPPPWAIQQDDVNHASLNIYRDAATGAYSVTATFAVFASKAAREQNLNQVDVLYVKESPVDLGANLVTSLYAALKAKYPNAVDA